MSKNDSRRAPASRLGRGFAVLCVLSLAAGDLWTGPIATPGRSSYTASPVTKAAGAQPVAPEAAGAQEGELDFGRAILETIKNGDPEVREALPDLLSVSEAPLAPLSVDEASTLSGPLPARGSTPRAASRQSAVPAAAETEATNADAESEDKAAPAPKPAKTVQPKRKAKAAAAPPPSRGFKWPVRAPVTSPFGWRWGRMHEGVDLGAGAGRTIRASKAGRVILSGRFGGYGLCVIVDHGYGYKTLYAHASRLLVRRGQRVARGQALSKVGCTGHCFGPHLHFEVRKRGRAVNPLPYLRRG